MSLLKDLKNKQEDAIMGRKAPSQEEMETRILQPAILLNNMRAFFDGEKIPAKTRKAWSEHRTRLMDARWILMNVLGNCDEAGWEHNCKSTRNFHLKTINLSQPNGEWKISEYEADIKRDSAGREIIQLAVLWVDSLNKPDMQYINGVPAAQVQVNNSIPKELITAVEMAGRGGDDGELKGLLKDLISVMAQNQSQDFKPEPVMKADD